MMRAEEFLKQKGLARPTRILPLNLGVSLLTAGSMEEDNDLQDRWATLLANAADAAFPPVPRAYVSILEDLSPFDAQILDRLYSIGIGLDEPVFNIVTKDLPEKVIHLEKPGDEKFEVVPILRQFRGRNKLVSLRQRSCEWVLFLS